MIHIEPEPPRRKWFHYPKKWLGEESFYKDITTRTLSALLAALFIYLFAVAAGYISKPSVRGVMFTALTVIVVLVSPFIVMLHDKTRFKNKPKWVRVIVEVVTWIAFLIVVAAWIDVFHYDLPWP